jgi:hypothetical protein
VVIGDDPKIKSVKPKSGWSSKREGRMMKGRVVDEYKEVAGVKQCRVESRVV